jgi:hypothetical protein
MSATSKATIARRRRLKGTMSKWVESHRATARMLRHPKWRGKEWLHAIHEWAEPRWDVARLEGHARPQHAEGRIGRLP